MPLATGASAQALNALANVAPSTNLIGWASLHNAYSTTGANELPTTGFTPNYARVAVSWQTPTSTNQVALVSSPLPSPHNVPPGSTVAFIGLWSLQTGGTFAGMGANGGFTQYAFTSTAHTGTPADTLIAPGNPYTAGQQVITLAGQTAAANQYPSGLTVGQVYFVINPGSGATAGQFQLSTSAGGSAVNLGSAAGAGIVQAIALETFTGVNGTFQLNSDTLTVI